MNPFKKTAFAAALAGLLLGSGAANAQVTYNASSGPTSGPADGSQAGPWTDGDPGYAGDLPATWVAFIHNDGGVANAQTASSADAGFPIGIGAKAYRDGSTNWGHTADFGLLELAHAATVTITAASSGSDLRPAFGLWDGWDTSGSGGSRHQDFLSNGALLPGAPNPLTSALGAFRGWTVAPAQGTTASASLSLFLAAGQYTLILGGYNGTSPGANLAYTATLSAAAAPVPIPAAVWLFGSALGGLGVFGRRQKTAA